MKHRNCHFVVGYWSRVRQGRAVPDQADIDPRALKRLLPSIFLLDMHGTEAAGSGVAYRLAGTLVCERMGGELRGKNYLAHWDVNSRKALGVLLRQALRLGSPVCLTSLGGTDDGRMVEIETVLMPLSFGRGEPERFLGVMQVLGDTAAAGCVITFERLVASTIMHGGDVARTSDFAPPPPDSGLAIEPQSRAPHLRLVVSRGATDPLRFDAPGAFDKIFALYGGEHVLGGKI